MPNWIIRLHDYLKAYLLINSDVNGELMTYLETGTPFKNNKNFKNYFQNYYKIIIIKDLML